MNLERKALDFEIKAAADGGEFEGYASVFHKCDSYGDIVAAGAFTDGLGDFLLNGFIGGLNHDWYEPIGKPLEAKEDARGLYAKAKISDTAAGRDVRTLLKDGVIKKLSIGFRTQGREYLESADDVLKYWAAAGYTPTAEDLANAKYGARLITKVKLYEFSPVTVPANSGCDITSVKSDPPAGRTFADHSKAVLATVEEFVDRAKGLQEKRAADDRTISPDRLAEFRRLRTSLDALLTGAEPPVQKADPAAALAAAARFAEISAGLQGVPL